VSFIIVLGTQFRCSGAGVSSVLVLAGQSPLDFVLVDELAHVVVRRLTSPLRRIGPRRLSASYRPGARFTKYLTTILR